MISLIIPVYNNYPQIIECAKSIKECAIPELEIILVNNNSTDYSVPIAQYLLKGLNVRTITCKNQGQNFARNKGLEIAKGQYIKFLDADDTIHQDLLKHQYESLKRKNSICFSNWIWKHGLSEELFNVQEVEDFTQYHQMFGNTWIPIASILIPRERVIYWNVSTQVFTDREYLNSLLATDYEGISTQGLYKYHVWSDKQATKTQNKILISPLLNVVQNTANNLSKLNCPYTDTQVYFDTTSQMYGLLEGFIDMYRTKVLDYTEYQELKVSLLQSLECVE